MRTAIILILITLLLLGGAYMLYAELNAFCQNMESSCRALYDEIDEDANTAADDAEALCRYWQRYEPRLCYILDHNEVEAISIRLLRTAEWLQRGQGNDAAIELRELIHLLQRLPRSQGIDAESIL